MHLGSRCGEDDLLKFKPSIRMGKKEGDLSDFERGMLLVPDGWSEYFKNYWSTGIFSTTISRVYREWSEKEKISSKWHLCGRKCLVDVRGQRRIGRLVRDDRKATVTQITTRYNQGTEYHLWTQHVEPWSRWAPAAEDHTGCRSCQLRTGNGGYNSHRLTKIGQ